MLGILNPLKYAFNLIFFKILFYKLIWKVQLSALHLNPTCIYNFVNCMIITVDLIVDTEVNVNIEFF